MKNGIKLFISILIILLIVIGLYAYRHFENVKTQMKLVVVKVEDKCLKTIQSDKKLMSVSVKNEDTSKFKEGQEIMVYYDGVVLTSYPGQIIADKIEILKEKSNIEIPLEVLRFYNFSQKNITVSVENLTKTSMELIISDKNKYPLDYGDCFSYTILKKNIENENYNQNVEFDYEAYTPPVTTDTYTTTSSYNPDPNRFKKVWEEIELIGNEEKNCEWEIVSRDEKVLSGKCDWTNLYGELGQGEYEFKAYRNPQNDDTFFQCIVVHFTIDENGEIFFEEPELGW